MIKSLEKLNNLESEIAHARFLDCCGSDQWASLMEQARPFADLDDLLNQAEQIWQSLSAEDWLEAFASHPKIGSRKAAPKQQQQAAEWSKGEQSGTRTATETVLDRLAGANRLYENKFGYIFIVCATGKSAEEMLAICETRLNNEVEIELPIAAEEQRKITEIRLKKLLETGV
jgi:OHCU decarboxylase